MSLLTWRLSWLSKLDKRTDSRERVHPPAALDTRNTFPYLLTEQQYCLYQQQGVKHSVFNIDSQTRRVSLSGKHFLATVSCQNHQSPTCQHGQALGARFRQRSGRSYTAWNTDMNIQNFSPRTTRYTHKHQIFRSLYLNQLKTYSTAEDNTKQLLVYMVISAHASTLSRTQLFPFLLLKKTPQP